MVSLAGFLSRRALLPIALGIIAVQVVGADDAIPRAKKLLGSLPIVFEPNAGRWDSKVKFSANTADYRVLLSASGVEFTSNGDRSRAVSISPLNANPDAQLSGDGALPFRTNYFLGSHKETWRTGVANYSRVRYTQVYPGVDLVYYGSNQDLEYDFVVHPGADPSRIRLKFQGVKTMSLNAAGDLIVDSGFSRLVQRRPLVYQDDPVSGRREIRGQFKQLAKNVIGFALDPYDRSRALTIDPVLTYSTLFGGSGPDRVTAALVDRSGNVFLTGYVGARDINATSAFPTDPIGDYDIFLARIDPRASGAASLTYFTYIGGSGADLPTAIAQDNAGNVYLTGSTTSINFPLAGGGPQNSLNQGVIGAAATLPTDAFVTMIHPASSGLDALFFSTYLGGAAADIAYGIAIDSQNSIYIVGSTKSSDDTTTADINEGFPVTDAAYQKVSYGPGDAFIAKIVPSASPSLVFSSYLGGEQSDEGRTIAVSPSGAVYIAGITYSAGLPQAGRPYRVTGGGNGDLFVAQLDLTKSGEATLIYMTFLGGNGFESITKMTLDSADRVLVTGYTLSPDFPVTANAYQSRLPGIASPFVTRLDLKQPGQAGLSYSTFLGGSNGDVPYDIALDAAGSVYLTGYTVSTDFPVTPDALQSALGGGINVFIAKLKIGETGPSTLQYSTFVGQTGVNVGYAIAVSADGKTIYVAGQTGARSVGVTDSAFQGTYAGGTSDGFLLVLGQ